MAGLDTLAAPVLNEALTTTSRHIPQPLLAFVAGWSAKVSALHELARYEHDGTATAITPEGRRHIKRRLRPPLGTSVWLAAAEWGNALPTVDQTTLRMFSKDVGRPPRDAKDTHSTTISFGHLVLQLFGTTSATRLKPGSGPFAEHSVRIWPDPPRGGIVWPTGKLFTENEVTGLARSVEQSLTLTIAPMGPT